jgi:hypothetical protein
MYSVSRKNALMIHPGGKTIHVLGTEQKDSPPVATPLMEHFAFDEVKTFDVPK